MKRVIVITAGILCAVISVAYLYNLREDCFQERLRWNAAAEKTFVEALNLEIRKRAETPVPMVSKNFVQKQKLEEPIPDSVTITSEYGRRTYRIPRRKYDYSIVKRHEERGMLSVLFEEHPLSADTLNMLWDSLLVERQIPVTSQIRYSLTDLQEHVSVMSSKSPKKALQTDSLVSRYMGYRCEMEVTGFVVYDNRTVFGGAQWLGGLLPWLIFGLLIAAYDRLCACFNRWFVKKEVVVEKEIIIKEKEVVVDRVVRAVDEEAVHAKLYKLKEGVYFNSETNAVATDEAVLANVAPQAAILLKAFFHAENQRLTEEEIRKVLWNDKGESFQLHMPLRRLRKVLEEFSDLEVHHEGGRKYRLKIKSN